MGVAASLRTRPGSHIRNLDDVPSQVVPQDKFTHPRTLFATQHQAPPRIVIAEIAFRRDPKVLINVCAAPGVVVLYVGVQLLVCSRERK